MGAGGFLQDIGAILQSASNPNAVQDMQAQQAAQDQGYTGTQQQLGQILSTSQNPQDAISKLAQLGTPEAVAMAQKYQAQLPAFNPLSPKDILTAQTDLYKANPLTQDAPNLAALGGAQQPQQPAALGQAAQGAQQAPATPQVDPRTLSGDDYLGYIGNKMGPGFANQVKAISEGRQAPPPPGSRATQAALLNQAVAQYKPDFDFANASQDFKARQDADIDFQKGTASKSVQSLGTASNHLTTLLGQIGGTSSVAVPLVGNTLNAIDNWYNTQSGSAGTTKFNDTADKLASELGAVYKGAGHNSDTEIKNMRDALNPSGSLEQKVGAVDNALTLMQGRGDELAEQWNRTHRNPTEQKQWTDFLSPQAQSNIATARQAISNYKTNGTLAIPGQQSQGTSSQQPQSSPAAGLQAPVVQGAQASKTIGGQTYHLVNGKWYQ